MIVKENIVEWYKDGGNYYKKTHILEEYTKQDYDLVKNNLEYDINLKQKAINDDKKKIKEMDKPKDKEVEDEEPVQ